MKQCKPLTDSTLAELPFYAHQTATFAGIADVIIATTGYTGSGGLELYIPTTQVQEVWEAVFKAGEAFGIAPIGLAARDTLRLEMGYCLIRERIKRRPIANRAGLGWVTRPQTNFINSEALGKEKTEGTSNKIGWI